MKYLVFVGDYYYPSGGWDDFSSSFDSLDDAIKHIKSFDADYKWAHVVYAGKIILEAFGKAVDFYHHHWELSKVPD